METQPLVSIISGYYNRENYVDESITSLINQSYSNIEIIIFDDNSKDNTYQKLKSFEDRDSRVKIIRHAVNKGFVRGIIDAIAIAKGEFIAIHGSGDISFRNRIALQAEVLASRSNVGVVGCYLENVTFASDGRENVRIVEKDLDGDAKHLLLTENPFTHGEVMFRRSIYDKTKGYRELFTFTQDFDLWCRMSFYGDFYIVKEVLYRRFMLADGASVKTEKKILQQMLREFAIQNHELKLNNKTDVIDHYGIQSLFYFDFTKRYLRRMLPIILAEFKSKGRSNKAVSDLVLNFYKKDKEHIITKILYIIYFKIPEKSSQYLCSKRKFQQLLYLFLR
jgi:glycosyltransferase involved in cell wall biosynthesis